MNKLYLLSLLLFMGLAACTYELPVRTGEMAIERKQYAVAIPLLQKEFRKAKSRKEKSEIAYRLGRAYAQTNRPEEAIEWYKISYDNGGGVNALREYARTLKQAERYEEAIVAYRDLGFEIGSPFEYRREIQGAEQALEWLEEERKEYEATLLPFNTGSADYAPVPFADNQLVITSDRGTATGEEIYNWTGNSFSDLFLVDLDSDQVTNFDPILNSEDNEGTIAFNASQTEAIFTRCTSPAKYADAFCKLVVSERNADGTWSQPRPLGFMQEEFNYMHPALSADGQLLYFSSDFDEGWGGYDIWVSEKQADGTWGEPTLLSRGVNTPYDEQFPYLDADTLYFASTGHTSLGGLDIFSSYQLRGRWTPAYNLKPPINSGGDDFGLVFDPTATAQGDVLRRGYFSSRRLTGAGGDDVYRFDKVKLPPLPDPPEEIAYKNLLDVFVLERIYEDPTNPNSRVLGRRPLEGSSLLIQVADQSQEVAIDESGQITLTLADDQDYNFLASKDGYLKNDGFFSSKGLGKDPNRPEQRYEVEIVLDKIFLNREIVLENIYYDFDESYIREDAEPTLNELAQLLERNPEISIQLGSHTDCRGNDNYNEALSQRRAQAAVDYLITKGIDAARLQAKGYGESVPANDCVCLRCTEDEHQENRRTTFAIVDSNSE